MCAWCLVNNPSDLVIGVDGGGSKTLAVLADRSGRELGRGLAGGSNYQAIGVRAAQEAILTAIRAAFISAGLPFTPVKRLCLGLAGIGRPEDRDWVQDFFIRARLAEHLMIANDGQILIWAGTPAGWGVGVISGTGSIAYGRNPKGNEARSGGWGYVMGDEGSGYAIGLAALRAVARATDGRGPATTLTDRILRHWGLSRPWDLVGKVYRSGAGRGEIAALAELVLEEAAAGDQAASQIKLQAARDLADAAVSVARQLGLEGNIPCALGGGVLAHQAHLATLLVEQAAIQGIRLDPVERVVDPVRGAIRIALQG